MIVSIIIMLADRDLKENIDTSVLSKRLAREVTLPDVRLRRRALPEYSSSTVFVKNKTRNSLRHEFQKRPPASRDLVLTEKCS